MKTTGFIPGLWQDEIHVTDFLNLNRKEHKTDKFLCKTHELIIEKEYDLIEDLEGRFTILKSYDGGTTYERKKGDLNYLLEDDYEKYVKSGDNRKLTQMRLLQTGRRTIKESLFNPDICAVALYGTKHLIRMLKEYIKDLESQLQNVEWIQRRISNNRSLEALYLFETFAEKNGVQVKKPAITSEDVANVVWITTLYAVLESPQTPLSLYSIFTFLDVFLEEDINKKRIGEEQAQRIVDELYCKLAALVRNSDSGGYNLNYTISSGQICKTVFRVLESAVQYSMIMLPLQFVFNSEPFPESVIDRISELFDLGHNISFSQSLRKTNATDLTVSPSHTFFRNYEDINFEFASFDLEKALMVAINGGRDVTTNSLLNISSKSLNKTEIEYEKIMIQFEMFLKFFVTYYVQYCNLSAYYWDQYHLLPFRQSLVSSYPHYLINMPYHNIKKTINLLTAIYEEKFKLEMDDKGYVERIVPETSNKEEFIGARLNDIIHLETSKMLFYKNGTYNIVFFSDKPYYIANEMIESYDLSPISFLKTSFSGNHSVTKEEIKGFIHGFKDTSYTHVLIHKR